MAPDREHNRRDKFERYYFLRKRLRDFGWGAIVGGALFSSGGAIFVGLACMTAAYLGNEGSR